MLRPEAQALNYGRSAQHTPWPIRFLRFQYFVGFCLAFFYWYSPETIANSYGTDVIHQASPPTVTYGGFIHQVQLTGLNLAFFQVMVLGATELGDARLRKFTCVVIALMSICLLYIALRVSLKTVVLADKASGFEIEANAYTMTAFPSLGFLVGSVVAIFINEERNHWHTRARDGDSLDLKEPWLPI